MWGSFGSYIWFLFKSRSYDLYRGQKHLEARAGLASVRVKWPWLEQNLNLPPKRSSNAKFHVNRSIGGLVTDTPHRKTGLWCPPLNMTSSLWPRTISVDDVCIWRCFTIDCKSDCALLSLVHHLYQAQIYKTAVEYAHTHYSSHYNRPILWWILLQISGGFIYLRWFMFLLTSPKLFFHGWWLGQSSRNDPHLW